MFSKIFAAIGLSIVIATSLHAAIDDPRIEYNKGGPDYASVLNDIAMKGKDRQDNAASLYVNAFELYRPEPAKISQLQIWQSWPAEMNDDQRAMIDEWLIANQPAIAKLKQGSIMPFFWLTYPKDIPLGAGPLSTYTQVNSLANVVCWQAKVKAADGDIEDAFDDIMTAYQFGRLVAAAPHTIAEQTTGFTIQSTALWTAIQIINRAKPDTAILANFQKELQSTAKQQNFYFDLTAARFWINDAIDRTFTSDGQISNRHLDAMKRSLNLSAENAARWQQLNEAQTASQSKELFAFLDKAGRQTPWQLKKNAIDLPSEIDRLTTGNVLLEHYRPDIAKNTELPFQCKAQLDALITICAVKRYAAEHNAMPPTLKVLTVSGYLASEPQDPYRDGPLSYVDVPNDFRLYSWGADFKDNFARPSKWGQGPQGGDAVFWPIP